MRKIEELYLEIIKMVWNPNFDGEAISGDLEAHYPIIRSFIPGHTKGSLRSLYSLSQGKFEIDTIYILAFKYDAPMIRRMAEGWNPSSVTSLTGIELEGASGVIGWESDDFVVVRVWWDI